MEYKKIEFIDRKIKRNGLYYSLNQYYTYKYSKDIGNNSWLLLITCLLISVDKKSGEELNTWKHIVNE